MYILCIMVMHIMPMHMLRSMSMTMQIFHIMIMIFMFLIKNHIKVARIQTGFFTLEMRISNPCTGRLARAFSEPADLLQDPEVLPPSYLR